MADETKKAEEVKKATVGDAIQNPDLLKGFAEAIAAGMRQAQIDPVAEARKERDRNRLRSERAAAEEERERRERRCAHRREDMTSAVAWYTYRWDTPDGQQRNVTKGVCQHCNKWFEPGIPGYEEMLGIQTYRAKA